MPSRNCFASANRIRRPVTQSFPPTMRLRIQTFSPLPELKAWFIPQIQDAQETIFDLKVSLCDGVKPLRDSSVQAKNITLQLEGFELLDDSPISAARDGDLIFVKADPSIVLQDVGMDAGICFVGLI